MIETTQPPQILLVEDDPNDIKLTLYALERARITNNVHVVRSGADALDFLFGRGAYTDRSPADVPTVVLLDLKLPLVDGIEVLRTVRADGRLRKLPVVVLTSSGEDTDLQTCYELGVNSYVVKPVDAEDFFGAVSRIAFYWLTLNQRPQA